MVAKKDLKALNKKSGQELQDYLAFKRRGSVIKPKKGKGSFKRQKGRYSEDA